MVIIISVWEKLFNPLTSKSKPFYELLISKKLEFQEVLLSGKKIFVWTTQVFPKPFLR